MPFPHSSFRFAPRQRHIEPRDKSETVLIEDREALYGEQISETYEMDIIHALVQDPFRVFIYWELTADAWEGLRFAFPGREPAEFRIMLRLEEISEGYEARFDVPAKGSYWMAVYPGKRYQFEVGVYHEMYGFIAILRSNLVSTPRGTVSPEVDSDGDYSLGIEQFMRVLEVSGFGGHKDFAAAVYEQEDDDYSRAFERLPESMRALIARAARGDEISEEELRALPARIMEIIASIRKQSGPALASAAIFHFIPEILRRQILEEEGRELHAFPSPGVSPRFLIGSSDLSLIPIKRFERRPDLTQRVRSGRSIE